ncbi:MAG: hypothetical protein ACI8Q1_001899 [Parvicella sp.]|jgi:hypothetical protein
MTYSTIIKNWLITIIIGSMTASLTYGFYFLEFSNLLGLILWFILSSISISIKTLVCSIPYIIIITSLHGMLPITKEKLHYKHIFYHILGTLFNITILLFFVGFKEVIALLPISLNYMTIGLVVCYYSIRKTRLKGEHTVQANSEMK